MDTGGDVLWARPGAAGVDPAEFVAAGDEFGGVDVAAAGELVGLCVAHGVRMVGCVVN